MSDAFNFQRVIISLILSLLLIITFCIPISFVRAFASPLMGMGKIYPLTLGTEGDNEAGIKGYDYEYAYLKTSEWTTLIADLEDGNSMLRIDLVNIPGTGINLEFGITYNSFNSSLNIGLGKGWTSDLHQSVYEDPLTHNVTCVSGSGAKLIFEYNTESGKYNSPKGFSGELTKKGDGTYEIKTIGKEKLTFDNTGKLRRVEKCGGGSYEVNYDASGRPSSMIDTISGRNITLTWDETGKLTEVKDSMNQTWTLNYSEDGNKLLSVTKPDNTLTTFNYSDDYKLTEQVDFEGHSYQLGYYTEGVNSGKLESWTDPSTATTTFNYETNVGGCEKKTTLTDGEGRNTFYCFGESEHLEEVSEVSGSTEIKLTIQYDPSGLISSFLDSYEKRMLEITRDTVGHPLTVSYPTPEEAGELFIGEKYTYTPANSLDGNLTKIEERVNENTYATTTMEYGVNNDYCNPTKITDPLGTQTNITYNANNQPTSISTGTGSYGGSETKSMSFSYNPNNGNLSSTTDFQGNLSTYSYNANGFPTNIKSYEGTAQLLNDKTISYDAMNKATGTADAVTGLTSSVTRDDNGATTSTTSEGGCSNSNAFDALKNAMKRAMLKAEFMKKFKDFAGESIPPWASIIGGFEGTAIDPGLIIPPYVPLPVTQSNTQGHITSYEYYKDGSIKKVTNYLGRSTNYYNDPFGRLNHILDWDGTDTHISYNLNSQIISRDVEGIGLTTYSYDNAGRLVTLSDPIKGIINYTYNLRGDLLSDEKGTYSYDLLGRRVSASYTGGGSDSWTYSKDSFLLGKNEFTFQRDKLGNMTSYSTLYGNATINFISALSLPTNISGTGNLGSYSLNYDNKHWLHNLIDTGKLLGPFTYSWNQDGTLSGIQYPNNTLLNITYHNRIQDNITLTKGGNTLFSADGGFDEKDRLTSEAIDITTPIGPISEDYSFSYDALSRLNTLNYSSNNRTITYGYDVSIGDRLTSVNFSDTGTYNITYDERGRIDYVTYPNNQGTEEYTYNDPKGRLSNITYPDGKSLSFSWNSRGKLTQLIAVEGGTNTTFSFSYDGMNKISGYNKTTTEVGMPPQTENWNFYYGITGIEKATRLQNGLQNLTIDYSTDTNGRILSAAYNETEGFNGELFYTFDSFGNTVALTNTQGNVIVGYLYDLNNGAIKSEYNPQEIDNPYKGGGKEGTLSVKPFEIIVFDIPERGMWTLRETFTSIYIDDWGTFAVAGNWSIGVGDEIKPCGCPPGFILTCCRIYKNTKTGEYWQDWWVVGGSDTIPKEKNDSILVAIVCTCINPSEGSVPTKHISFNNKGGVDNYA